jgi:hypothetical protein
MIKRSNKTNKDKKILSLLKTQYNKNTELSKIVCNILPDEFSLSIFQCFYNQNTLTIVISNQLLASKLRYNLPYLKQQLQKSSKFHSLRKIRLQINTSMEAHKQQVNHLLKPIHSDKSSELLLSLSDSIDNDELKLSLKKLSQHIKTQKHS